MKRIAVLRHAKSRPIENNGADFDRPLNAQGWADANRIGRELTRRQLRFDMVLASPAIRVRETLAGVQETFELPPVRYERTIYLAGEQLLFALLRSLPQEVHQPLLVGHNPGLQRLILAICDGEHGALHDQVAKKFSTAALALIAVPTVSWEMLQPGTGQIKTLIDPRDR